MPTQAMESAIPMSFAGSVLPMIDMAKEIILSIF